MFGNFLEETATGTGATLALAGVTTGNIAFQEKFADGDLVAYVLEDSGGTIKVGGIGTYVSATDDITRDDTWNWNGSTYDDNPATNITLSGGTHTVRCDVLSDKVVPAFVSRDIVSGQVFVCGTGTNYSAAFGGMNTGTIYYIPFRAEQSKEYSIFGTEIATAVASGKIRLAIYTQLEDGSVGALVAETAELDASTTGFKEESQTIFLENGLYFSALQIDNTTISPSCADITTGGSVERVATNAADAGQVVSVYSATQTYGAFPTSPPQPTATNTNRQMLVYLEA